jgi:hypothetical protein
VRPLRDHMKGSFRANVALCRFVLRSSGGFAFEATFVFDQNRVGLVRFPGGLVSVC